jgi:hypothetical protein
MVQAEAQRPSMTTDSPASSAEQAAVRRLLSQRLSRSVVIVGFLAGIFYRSPLAFNQLAEGTQMKESDKFRENAANCAMLAKDAKHGPARIRYKRMETAWLSLADEQDWLDGEVPPENIAADCDIRKTPPV